MAFTSAQQTEIDRMSSERQSELTLTKLEKYSVASLKARVNILSVSDAVNFSPENNYTVQEQAYIQAAYPITKWMIVVPEILERAATLESEGMSSAAIVEILRGKSQ
jgi:hypothetical protein